jgi:tetratricopeptide (TPR) repeat protein
MARKLRNFSTKGENGHAENQIIEEKSPLSKSVLWDLQKAFFDNQGPDAWIKGIVPQYVTTNPYIAKVYAKTAFGYCRDYFNREDFDREKTLYIMELAAGVGRFTYVFLKCFTELLKGSSLRGLKFKYIVSDFSEKNINYWQQHECLKEFFEAGVLDCATFDLIRDEEIRLRNSGELLEPGNLKNPLLLFANYTVDSLPLDSFFVGDGVLYEGLLTLTKTPEGAQDGDNSILAGLDYYYTDNAVEPGAYYEDEAVNRILTYYRDRLPDTSFSMPITALRAFSRLRKIFNDDIAVLAVDKGYKNEKSILNNSHTFLSKHGCVSTTVNFHAIEQYFKNLGGEALHSIYEHVNVNMSLFLLSDCSNPFDETRMAYKEFTEGIGPDEFYLLKKGFIEASESFTSKQLLAFIRYTGWDSKTFLDCYNIFLERCDSEENFPIEELISAVGNVWDNYFPIGEEDDLAYYLGSMMNMLGYQEEALKYYETSFRYYGGSAEIFYKLALCHFNLGHAVQALEFVNESLRLDPVYRETRNMKILIEDLMNNSK